MASTAHVLGILHDRLTDLHIGTTYASIRLPCIDTKSYCHATSLVVDDLDTDTERCTQAPEVSGAIRHRLPTATCNAQKYLDNAKK